MKEEWRGKKQANKKRTNRDKRGRYKMKEKNRSNNKVSNEGGEQYREDDKREWGKKE